MGHIIRLLKSLSGHLALIAILFLHSTTRIFLQGE
jgi:hypothetical protein